MHFPPEIPLLYLVSIMYVHIKWHICEESTLRPFPVIRTVFISLKRNVPAVTPLIMALLRYFLSYLCFNRQPFC